MSFGEIAAGMTGAFAEYLQNERKTQREREDQQLHEQMQMIDALIKSPNINPNIIGKALTDLSTLSAAKASQRTMKSGKAGFIGASELPVSQLLSGLQSGLMPVQGPTATPVQTPKEMGLDYNVPIPAPKLKGFDGKDVLSEPIMLPPEPLHGAPDTHRMLDAARDVQQYGIGGMKPVANQPLFRTPQEIGREKGEIQAETQTYLANAAIAQKMSTINKYITDPAQKEQAIASVLGVMPKVQGAGQRYTYTDPTTGESRIGLAVVMNGRVVDGATGLPLPSDAQWYQPERPMSLDQSAADALGQGNDQLAQQFISAYRQMHPQSMSAARDPYGRLTSNALQSNLNQVMNSYRADPITKQYTQSLNGWQTMQRIPDGTNNPADNIAMIYAFAKLMDPESVVREGEYATVQKYAQSWLQSFGFNVMRILNNQEFLSPQAMRNMRNAAGIKFKSLDEMHKRTRDAYLDRAQQLQEGGSSFNLPDYSGDMGGAPVVPNPPTAGGADPHHTQYGMSNQPPIRKPIPGHPGQFAISRDGGKTWVAE